MSKKHSLILVIFLALFQIFFAGKANAQSNTRLDFKERFPVQAVRLVFSAEITYQATFGAGTFGSLEQLRQVEMIDSVLASGEKYGYTFALTVTHPTATTRAKFSMTATPRSYPKTGRRSFYIDETGEMRGADKNGAAANANDPIIDNCASFGIFINERCVINDLRTLYSAELTYYTTVGAGTYGNLMQLFAAGLINSRIASGTNHDYVFEVLIISPSAGTPAFFNIRATPTRYGVTGTRSFYIDVNGVIRGGDKQGLPADENDPPIND